MSEVEQREQREQREDRRIATLDDEDRVWLEARLVEYLELLEYLGDQ